MRKLLALALVVVVLAPFGVSSAAAAPAGTGDGVVERDRSGGYWVLTSRDGTTYSLERRSSTGFNNDMFRASTKTTAAMAYDEANDALWYHDGPVVHRYLERQTGGGDTVIATLTDITGMDDGQNGALLVVDQGQLRQVTTTGTVIGVAGATDLTGVRDVVRGSNNSVWVLTGDKLYRITAGTRTEVASGFDDAVQVDVQVDGRALVGERQGRRIAAVSPQGVVSTFVGGIDPVASMTISGTDLYFVTRPAAGGASKLTRVNATSGAPVSPTGPTSPTTPTTPAPAPGYRFVARDGGVFTYGSARFYGSTGNLRLAQPIVGGASTSNGYWLVGRDGGVFAFGGARFLGSAAGTTSSPVVAVTGTPGGDGYWVVEQSGRVHAYGAAFAAAAAATPVVAAAPNGTGGLLLAHRDGSVELRGNTLHGGRVAVPGLRSPVVGLAPVPDGTGFWVTTADGQVFTGGSAATFGSMAGKRLNAPIVDIVATPTGRGYWLLGADGGVFSFGDARFLGSTGARRLNQPIVGAIAG